MYANEAQRTPRSCCTVAETAKQRQRGRKREREGESEVQAGTQMLLKTGYLVAMPMPHVAATPAKYMENKRKLFRETEAQTSREWAGGGEVRVARQV